MTPHPPTPHGFLTPRGHLAPHMSEQRHVQTPLGATPRRCWICNDTCPTPLRIRRGLVRARTRVRGATPRGFRVEVERPTCLRDVSSHAHVFSRRRVPSPDLSSATVFSREHGFATGSALTRAVRSGSVLGRPRVFAPKRVFAGNVSSDAHFSLPSSPGMCLLTPKYLRRPCFEASVLDPTCLQNVCLRSSANMCTPPGDCNVTMQILQLDTVS